MNESIPEKIIRNIIADTLFERANHIDNIVDEMIKNDETDTDYTGDIGWTACGTRALSDDVRAGIIPLEEAVEVLTPFERKEAKRKCQEWLKERQENLER